MKITRVVGPCGKPIKIIKCVLDVLFGFLTYIFLYVQYV